MDYRLFLVALLAVIPTSWQQGQAPTIWAIILSNPNTTRFAKLVQEAGLNEFLNSGTDCNAEASCLTVLAPNNWAVDAILAELKWANQNNFEKKNILQSLMVQGNQPVLTSNWMDGGIPLNLMDIGFGAGSSLETLFQSQRFAFQSRFTSSVTDYFVNNAVVVQANVMASNGVLHITNEMLYTPNDNTALMTFLSTAPNLKISADLWSKLMEHPKYQPFIRQKQGNTPLYATYFMVTDQGWAGVPSEQLDRLRKNITLLATFLAHHYCPNQILFIDWTKTHTVINMYTGFPDDPAAPEKSMLNQGSLRRALDGKVTMQSASYLGSVNRESTFLLQAVVHTINSPIGFVYRTAEEIINGINPALLVACKADTDCNALLTSNSKLTYFVPTSQSFRAFLQLPATEKAMYLKLLVLKDEIYQRQMTNIRTIRIGNTQKAMRFHVSQREIHVEGRLPTTGYVAAKIVSGDQQATNGVVHQIEGVPGLPVQTVEQFVAANSDLSQFSAYKFVETMKRGGPYTFLVPTNAALKSMTDDVNVGKRLLDDQARRGYIFLRHAFPLKLLIDDLSVANRYAVASANYAFTREKLPMSLAVLNDNTIEGVFSLDGKTMRVSTASGEYQCTNGLVYLTNSLLYSGADLTANICTSKGC